ncbi:MAG TPA: ATP-binding protein [Sphingobacteriaceae bacterium]
MLDPQHTAFLRDELFYKYLIDSVEDYAIFSTDLQGSISTWNRGAEVIMGYSPAEIVGKNARILFTEEDIERKQPEMELRHALERGRAINERNHVRKDGSQFWGSGLVFPLKDKNGNHQGYIKIMRNLTETRLAEMRLFETKVYAESIVETASEPLLILTRDLTVKAASPPFCELFRLRPEELSGAYIYHFDWNFPGLKERLETMANNLESFSSYEFNHTFPVIGNKILMVSGRKLYQKGEELMLLMFEDVTEKRQNDRQKEDFISVASHELRTPITSIKALAQLLDRKRAKLDNADVINDIKRINQHVQKLTQLLNSLLDVSQLGGHKYLNEQFDLNELVNEIMEQVALIYPDVQITRQGSISISVVGDRQRLGQVVTNFLTNACKYSSGRGQVLLTLKEENDHKEALISVSDNGMGIPKAEQNKLFKRFYRTSNVANSHIPGLGLGLHISSEIVSKHGGKIWFESEEGKGSVFYFTLPLRTGMQRPDFEKR